MKVKELMTTDVATVTPETSLKEVASILAARGISGIPVVDGDAHVLGVVSEADILLKEQGRTREGGRFAWFLEPKATAEAAKLAARTAGEAMTSPAVTVGPERPASAAARIMVEREVNRLPVVKDERLVGIVTRADLVRAFTRPDETIEKEIRTEVVERALWLAPDTLGVTVREGEVELTGELATQTDAEVLERLVGRVPGVVSVSSRVTWRANDSSREAVAR
ncbi:MAG TPA: CBS domain-containing protein [Gaiellaceae bacterium]|nr:CBS domain-containing protein [Gaiellaceae bacterium]